MLHVRSKMEYCTSGDKTDLVIINDPGSKWAKIGVANFLVVITVVYKHFCSFF